MSKDNKRAIREIADEIDTFDKMFASLVEILVEKGILTQEELEQRIRAKASKAGGFTAIFNLERRNKLLMGYALGKANSAISSFDFCISLKSVSFPK